VLVIIYFSIKYIYINWCDL